MIHNTDRASKFTLTIWQSKNGGELLRHYRYDDDARVYYSVETTAMTGRKTEIIVYAIIRQIKGERYFSAEFDHHPGRRDDEDSESASDVHPR